MRKIKNILLSFGSVFVLAIGVLLVSPIGSAFAAAPYTCTWTGSGDDTSFSDSGNWSGCNSAAPQPGDNDNLVFDNTSLSSDQLLNNDITNLDLNSITFMGSGTNAFVISGNDFTVADGVSNTSATLGATIENNVDVSGNQTFSDVSGAYLEFDGALSGSGNITASGNGTVGINSSPSYTGSITDGTGDFQAWINLQNTFSLGGGSITITNGATLVINDGDTGQSNFNVPLNLSGSGDGTNGTVQVVGSTSSSLNLTGSIVLGSDATVSGTDVFPVSITGPLSGAFTIQAVSVAGATPSLSINSSDNTSDSPNSPTGGDTGESTSTSAPNTPDTGFGLTKANFILPVVAATILAGGIFVISRRLNKNLSTKR